MFEEPEVPPVDPEVPPPMLDVPEVPDDAAEPLSLFLCLAFLCFFFGVVVPAPVVSPAPEVVADGLLSVVVPAPEVSLEPVAPVELLPLPIGVPGMLLVLPEVDAPVPDELLPVLPEAPDEPVPDEPEVVSLVPDLFCMLGCEVLELLPVLESAPGLACASTTEDADATNTNDNDRIVVFNVMSNSLS